MSALPRIRHLMVIKITIVLVVAKHEPCKHDVLAIVNVTALSSDMKPTSLFQRRDFAFAPIDLRENGEKKRKRRQK